MASLADEVASRRGVAPYDPAQHHDTPQSACQYTLPAVRDADHQVGVPEAPARHADLLCGVGLVYVTDQVSQLPSVCCGYNPAVPRLRR